jgi:hypothetical protein
MIKSCIVAGVVNAMKSSQIVHVLVLAQLLMIVRVVISHDVLDKGIVTSEHPCSICAPPS